MVPPCSAVCRALQNLYVQLKQRFAKQQKRLRQCTEWIRTEYIWWKQWKHSAFVLRCKRTVIPSSESETNLVVGSSWQCNFHVSLFRNVCYISQKSLSSTIHCIQTRRKARPRTLLLSEGFLDVLKIGLKVINTKL